jgi:hypothetical protein
MIVDAPWYVQNTVIRRDLQLPTVKEEIHRYSSQYSARLSTHPNDLIVNLIELPDRLVLSSRGQDPTRRVLTLNKYAVKLVQIQSIALAKFTSLLTRYITLY